MLKIPLQVKPVWYDSRSIVTPSSWTSSPSVKSDRGNAPASGLCFQNKTRATTQTCRLSRTRFYLWSLSISLQNRVRDEPKSPCILFKTFFCNCVSSTSWVNYFETPFPPKHFKQMLSRQYSVLSILINWWEAACQTFLGQVSNCVEIAH